MTDRRACFDFDATFSNGGGLRGQGFRLDIDGDDIADEALAAYIIADLRLLMVGSVRILNKTIIEERHKRAAAAVRAPEHSDGVGHFVDLSHTIRDGLATYRGLPAPVVCDFLGREASRDLYAEGTEFQIGRIDMVANTGTHIDTPFHRFADGHDLCGLALDRISQQLGVVIRVQGAKERAIDWTAFGATPVRGLAVLVHTGWDARFRSDAYFEGHPFLTEAAAVYLRDQGAVLVGIDSFNIDDTALRIRPVHTVLLGAGIPIVEHLTGLEELPTTGFSFTAVAPRIEGLGAFPVGAHAVVPA